jgi:hypothetical protein
MDAFNNERGIKAAKELGKAGSFDDQTMFDSGVKAIKNGELRTINRKSVK